MKLYRVKVVHEALVLAESEEKARDIEGDILDYEEPDFRAVEMDPDDPSLPEGWDEDTYVYSDYPLDCTVGEARQAVKSAADEATDPCVQCGEVADCTVYGEGGEPGESGARWCLECVGRHNA